jgi:hypothetical protein
MKRLLIICSLLLMITALGFAQNEAVVKEASGKVEILAPPRGWTAAQVGMAVPLGATVSTGFNSRAVLDLGNAVLTVSPLTRMRIEELIEQEGTVKTDLYLRVGKVRAEVKTAAGLQQDFKLRSPVSTAAVRGTDLGYDGYNVEVYAGNVVYFNLLGQNRSYGAGEGGGGTGYGTPGSGSDGKENESGVNPYTTGPGGTSESGLSGGAPQVPTGGIIIVLDPIGLD